MGYDGVELACWGDHFEVDRALAEPDYIDNKWALLQHHGLTCFARSTHLVRQAVCDLIDDRHKAILPPDVWGDGEPEGVRSRAADKVKATAHLSPNPTLICKKIYNKVELERRGFWVGQGVGPGRYLQIAA